VGNIPAQFFTIDTSAAVISFFRINATKHRHTTILTSVPSSDFFSSKVIFWHFLPLISDS
jgi:hypothetical protein